MREERGVRSEWGDPPVCVGMREERGVRNEWRGPPRLDERRERSEE